jgi:hypothetical protein
VSKFFGSAGNPLLANFLLLNLPPTPRIVHSFLITSFAQICNKEEEEEEEGVVLVFTSCAFN